MDPAMERAIEDWINWLAVNKSQSTVKGYTWELRALARTLPGKTPVEVRTTDLTKYLAERRLNGAGPAAIKRSVAAFRIFFGYVVGQKKNPARSIPFPKVKRRRQRTLDDDQALSVLAACDTSTLTGKRDLALLCLLLDSGLRAAEVCRLQWVDVDLKSRSFLVVVKGGEQREGVFSSATSRYLADWLEARAARGGGGPTLFCSVGGTTPGEPLTTNGLRAIFRRIGNRAGLPRGFSPHDLRRTFATLAVRRGAPTRIVQVAGRWEDEAMVSRYTQALTARDFDPYSPVEGLLGE